MKELICKFCGKICGNAGGLTAHQHCCNMNPNKKKYYHSPKSGLKKDIKLGIKD